MASTDIHAFAGKMAAAATAARLSTRKAVQVGSLVITTAIRGEIRAAVPRGVLGGAGKTGTKVGVRFDVKGTRRPVGLIRAEGPLHLVERDTKAHDVTAKRKPLRTPYGPKQQVHVAGTKGKHPFRKGVEVSQAPAARAMREVITRETARALR